MPFDGVGNMPLTLDFDGFRRWLRTKTGPYCFADIHECALAQFVRAYLKENGNTYLGKPVVSSNAGAVDVAIIVRAQDDGIREVRTNIVPQHAPRLSLFRDFESLSAAVEAYHA